MHKNDSQQFISLFLLHALNNCVVCSRLPYSCLLLRICNMYVYANMRLFVLLYHMCSWCLIVIDLSVSRMIYYMLVHVSRRKMLCFVVLCLVIAYLLLLLFVRKAVFMLVCLNKLVILRISGL
jgi:hypothetical protein